ncbi:TPA: hypothetical protein ACT2HZ_002093, partial [Streptococcus suis]
KEISLSTPRLIFQAFEKFHYFRYNKRVAVVALFFCTLLIWWAKEEVSSAMDQRKRNNDHVTTRRNQETPHLCDHLSPGRG